MNDKKYGVVYVTTSDGRTWNFENAMRLANEQQTKLF